MKLITDSDGVYHVTFHTQKGTEGDVCLGTTDETTAHELAINMHVPELETVSSIVDLSHQVVTQIVAGKKLSVKDAVQVWLEHAKAGKVLAPGTVHTNLQYLNHWLATMSLDDKPLSGVQAKDISDYVNRGGEQRSTSVRKLTAIRTFFAFCQENGYMYRNPAGKTLVKVGYDVFKHEEKETREKNTFTDSELERLVELADPFWRCAIIIAQKTGLRLGDIAKLEWSSFKGNRLVVWTDKANKRVDLEIDGNIQAALDALPATDIRYVFPVQRETVLSPTKRALLSVQFRRLCTACDIHGKSFHCLRHTNATGLVQAGASLEVVAKRLGHTSTTTTQGYVHVS